MPCRLPPLTRAGLSFVAAAVVIGLFPAGDAPAQPRARAAESTVEEVKDWLDRMNESVETLSYRGSFEHRVRGQDAENLEIVHRYAEGEVIERISSARDEGDLKENGGYHAAKDEQGKIEARIHQLEDMLRTATTDVPEDDGVVSPGKLVTYRYAGDDEDEVFLLGAREVDDDHEDVEVFSPQSPLGSAMLGATKGSTIDFEAPNGKTLKIEIIDAVPFQE